MEEHYCQRRKTGDRPAYTKRGEKFLRLFLEREVLAMASTQTSGQGLNVHAVPVATTTLKDVLGPPPRYEDIGRYRRIRQGARRRNDLYERDSLPLVSYAKETPRQALDGSHHLIQETKSETTTSPQHEGGRKTCTHGHGRHQGTAKTCERVVDGKQRGTSTRSFAPITRNGRSRNEGLVKDHHFNSAAPSTTTATTAHRQPPPTYEESQKQSKYHATGTGSLELQFSSAFEVTPPSADSKGGRVCLRRDSRVGTIGSDANRVFRKGNRMHGVVSEGEDVIHTRLIRGKGGNREVDNNVRAVKHAQSEKLKRSQKPGGRSSRSTSTCAVDMASGEKAKALSCATYRCGAFIGF